MVDHRKSLTEGLEAALLKHPPSAKLEEWIVLQTSQLMVPAELKAIESVINGDKKLRLTCLLDRVSAVLENLTILTTNYDRLAEVACERAGYHVDTTALGEYGADFNPQLSQYKSCRGILQRGRSYQLQHCPRALILKPHGSLDWYRSKEGIIKSSIALQLPRAIITPGLNKYREGYMPPFDRHRELVNTKVRSASKLVVVGYGFNDDHLQVDLLKRIKDGSQTLIITRGISDKMIDIVQSASKCLCIGKPEAVTGVSIISRDSKFTVEGPEIWDLGTLVKEIL